MTRAFFSAAASARSSRRRVARDSLAVTQPAPMTAAIATMASTQAAAWLRGSELNDFDVPN
jgi:hypothetical protein